MKSLRTFYLCVLLLFSSHPLHSQDKSPSELFSNAYALYSQGKHAEAEEIFFKTLDGKFLLEDYSLYFLSLISFERSAFGKARHYLDQLKERFPRSVWSSDAQLERAKTSLAEKKYRQVIDEIRSLLAQNIAEKEIAEKAFYLLARAHEQLGELKQAYSLLQELRQKSPLSPWAARARKDVNRLREENPQLFALATPQALAEEAELLVGERDYKEAERTYRKILDVVPEDGQRPRYLLGLARVHDRARRREEAIPILNEIIQVYPESREVPAALHRLARILWNKDDNLQALENFKTLRERYPKSRFIDFAEFASAGIYESLGKPDEARRIYREFSRKFPSSPLRDEAQWRLAWIHYLQGKYGRAYNSFRKLANDKEAKRYKTAARYWQARAAEKMGRLEETREICLQIVNSPEESYYKGLAASRLEKMGVVFKEKRAASPPVQAEPGPSLNPNLSFHLARARELAAISLNHLAIAELDHVRDLNDGDLSSKLVLVREYERNRAYGRSVILANQIASNSEELNRHRYPLAYWEPIRKLAEELGVDPYLVIALIRQESLFDPKALSPASAFGLMQLLPSTATRVAGQLGFPPPQPQKLFEPDLNLILGIRYLKELLQRYSNNPMKALAAYNAGENALTRWEKRITAADEEEFIEKIPYQETRLYVQLVLRNHRIYRKIYEEQK